MKNSTYLHNTNVPQVKKFKILGLIFNEKLNWSDLIEA